LFGSNFPIEKLWTSYAAQVEAYRKAGSSLAPREQQAIFHDSAMRVYRIA
jgi:predicted TIM-barrel fold metal-dependent hydrolase